LNHTRGHLIELVNSTNVLISSVTLSNSPFWTVHPVYCRSVLASWFDPLHFLLEEHFHSISM
jgi:hypothetical protein